MSLAKPEKAIIIIAFICFCIAFSQIHINIGLASSLPAATPTATERDSDINKIKKRIRDIEQKIESIENSSMSEGEILEVQERIFTATVQRMEWNFNVFLAVITIFGILLGIFSFSFFNRLIEKSATIWFDRNAADRIDKKTEEVLSEISNKYDEKFADLYQKIEDAFTNGERK